MHVAKECSPGGGDYLSFECGLFNRSALSNECICSVLICCFYSVRGCTIATSAYRYAEIIFQFLLTELNLRPIYCSKRCILRNNSFTSHPETAYLNFCCWCSSRAAAIYRDIFYISRYATDISRYFLVISRYKRTWIFGDRRRKTEIY